MIDQILTVTHSMRMEDLFDEDHHVATFDSTVSMWEIFNSFTCYAHDAVIITEEALCVGILTLKEMIVLLQDFDNMIRPVKEFMTSPLLTFSSTQSVAEVLEAVEGVFNGKIVVASADKVIGIIDHSDLLSLCYSKIIPFLQHEYNLLHAVVGLVDDDGKKLLKLATTDPLTGIGNRRLLEDIFQAHQLLIRKEHVVPYLLIFDVDDFKLINDTYGHNIGDAVLKELTDVVGNSIRKSDIFVRWGGEEFAIFFRYTEPVKVVKIAENIRSIVSHHSFASEICITCSFGLASVYSKESLEEVIERADKALYKAKEDGKNCVRSADA